MILLLKLLFAHLLGDFVFQKGEWVKQKEKKKWRSGKLVLHVLVHGVLVFLVLLTEDIQQYWWILPVILVTHWIIDAMKLQFQDRKSKAKKWWFIGDQAAHVMVIWGIWAWVTGMPDIAGYAESESLWVLLVSILMLTQPTAIFVKVLISGWSPEESVDDEISLANAGMYIGILERLFVFGFVVTGNWEGIGFLLAAKSVFRFGDLNKSKDRSLTEYVLIGTLISFGIAILIGLIFVSLT